MANVGDGTGHSGMPKGSNAATMRPEGPQGSGEKGGKGPVLVKGGNRSTPLGGGKK